MNEERLLAEFNRVAEAPNAVPRLRRFLMDLAVRGKLVEQNSAEEPMAESVRRGAAEGEGTSEGLPVSWRCAALGDVLEFQYGKALKASERLQEGPVPVFGSNGVVGYTAEPLCRGPVIIVGRKGSAGALTLCNGPSWTTDVAYFVEPPCFLDLRYLYLALHTLDLPSLSKGVKPGLSRADAYQLLVPIPPLAEQGRIVSRMDELIALLDRLEVARVKRETARQRLTGASFARLTDPDASKAFPSQVRFIVGTFPELTTKSGQMRALRQSILNLAVQGKLVEQDDADEPAADLLKRIAEDKRQRATLARDRKSGPVLPLNANEVPFIVPQGWISVQFGDVVISRDGERVPVSKAEREGRAKIFDYYGASGVIDKIDGYLFDKPLLLIGEDGANLIARSTPVAFMARGKYWVNNHAHVLDGLSEGLLRYLELYINATNLEPYITGTAQPKMNQAKMNSIPVALPPLPEQHRIVAKVDTLMALCDRLQAAITAADSIDQRLLHALLCDALQGDKRIGEAA